ncbi:DUF6541 family protein [Microbacterium paraoxydans]|uniref:DUF6541 family protein n=1 Tax=Microbacterium paraoxydans TaxID=199592 RepID=UPI001CF97ADD|nr:DUF6541 family protein [Microbacterium paraoxydans]
MILTWAAQAPVVLVVALVVFVPGVVALAVVGLRGLALLAAAPLFTVAATSIVALAYGAIGIPWSVSGWVWGMLVVVIAAGGVGWVLRGRYREPRTGGSWVLPTALTTGMAIGIWRLVDYIADADAISQTNDAVFHMNAVRFILENADASSLHVSGMIGGNGFYPAAWHAIVSLIVLLTGTSIPIAANSLTIVIGALIWPIGIAWLTRVLTASNAVAGVAAILSGALQTFPLLMFQWGVLFPNALSLALLPAAIALVISLPLWHDVALRWRPVARSVVFVLVALAALVFSQPAALLPWAALLVLWATAQLLTASAPSRYWRWGLIAAAWAALAVMWVGLSRGTSGSHWPPFRGKLEVLLDVVLNGQLRIPFAVGVSVFMLVGLVVAWRAARMRWFVFAWLLVSGLYILVAAVGAPLIRENVLGAWYADPYRIAALAPLVVVPLAALGLHALVRFVVGLFRRRAGATETEGPVVIASLLSAVVFMLVLVLVRSVAMPSFTEGTFDRASRYVAESDSFLSPDERTLLESLDEYVEPGARVLSNPSTGAGFGYLFSGVDVFPRTWSTPRSEAWAVLAASLRDASTDPAVCEALAAYSDPEYVLDFGIGDVTPGRYESEGMTDFAGQPGFEKVAEVGDASLWRITACAR